MPQIQCNSFLVANGAHDPILGLQGTTDMRGGVPFVIDCKDLTGTMETRMVITAQVYRLGGFAIAERALVVLHCLFNDIIFITVFNLKLTICKGIVV